MDPAIDISASSLDLVIWYALAALGVIAVTYALTSWLTTLQPKLRGRTRLLTRFVSWLPVLQIGVWLAAIAFGAWFLADAPAIVILIVAVPVAVATVIGSRDFARDAIAGAILAFEHTILAGDIVHVATPTSEVSGRIVAIGVRRTLLHTNDDSEVFLPNQTLLNSIVRTNRERELDSPVEIDIPLDDSVDVDELRELALESAICSRFASIKKRPEFFVGTHTGSRSASLVAYAFSPEYVRHLESDILEMIGARTASTPD